MAPTPAQERQAPASQFVAERASSSGFLVEVATGQQWMQLPSGNGFALDFAGTERLADRANIAGELAEALDGVLARMEDVEQCTSAEWRADVLPSLTEWNGAMATAELLIQRYAALSPAAQPARRAEPLGEVA